MTISNRHSGMILIDRYRAAGLAIIVVLGIPTAGIAQRPVNIAPNAPPDRPVDAASLCQWKAFVRALEPYVKQARATYPAARQRFLAGLPPRETFFVTVRLSDSLGHHEQAFLAVDSIEGDQITGRIWSQIDLVAGFRLRQPYRTAEGEIIDWLIAKPDGTEEGNVAGKFLDTYQPPRDCRDPDRTG